MGLFSGLLGHASKINVDELEQEFSSILIKREETERADKLKADCLSRTPLAM